MFTPPSSRLTGRRPSARRIGSFGTGVLCVVTVLAGCGATEGEIPEPRRSDADAVAVWETRVERALGDFEAMLSGRRAPTDALASAVANANALQLRDVELRYVTEAAPGLSAGSGPVNFVAEVDVEWRQPGGSAVALGSVEIAVSEAAQITAVTASTAGRTPAWLVPNLIGERVGRVAVLGANQAARKELLRLGQRALAEIAAVLPQWRGPLVLVRPESTASMERLSGSAPGEAVQIAAITATVDGNLDRSAASHVIFNPEVMADLTPAGRQLVVTHEGTHVAVNAATSGVPTWLSEGFADYVALRSGRIPLEKSAGQILASVRRGKVPAQLPSNTDFGARSGDLGGTYESAWLAARLIAQVDGEAALVALYRDVDAGAPLDRALARITTFSIASLTQKWRDTLTQLAAQLRPSA